MKIRITAPGLLVAALCGAMLTSSPLVTAPPAHAACTAGQTYDPRTGVCWSQAQTTLGISGTGGTCLPGRLGLCMAGVQNSQLPGANLPSAPPAGPAPRSWP
jgi:hypothetical protein